MLIEKLETMQLDVEGVAGLDSVLFVADSVSTLPITSGVSLKRVTLFSLSGLFGVLLNPESTLRMPFFENLLLSFESSCMDLPLGIDKRSLKLRW